MLRYISVGRWATEVMATPAVCLCTHGRTVHALRLRGVTVAVGRMNHRLDVLTRRKYAELNSRGNRFLAVQEHGYTKKNC